MLLSLFSPPAPFLLFTILANITKQTNKQQKHLCSVKNSWWWLALVLGFSNNSKKSFAWCLFNGLRRLLLTVHSSSSSTSSRVAHYSKWLKSVKCYNMLQLSQQYENSACECNQPKIMDSAEIRAAARCLFFCPRVWHTNMLIVSVDAAESQCGAEGWAAV